MQKVGLKLKEKAEDMISPKQLLCEMVKLINADPRLMLSSSPNSTSEERHKASSDLINHLVTLVTTMLDLSSEAMEALLRLHHPPVIEIWNKDDSKDATIKAFWDIK
ncbi:neurofibromin-like [Watersipora subatra]|uniref:neurofibromin-like n=1 Tax=Watersipora subatra TaxID=2589382 RepID=UPI00355B0DE5